MTRAVSSLARAVALRPQAMLGAAREDCFMK